MRNVSLAFALALCVLPVAAHQPLRTPSEAYSARSTGSAVEARPLARVVTIGASVTDGFLLQADLSELLEAMLLDDEFTTASYATPFFFADPERKGAKAIEFVEKNEPTLVVALDFLFWFGYGAVGPYGARVDSEEDRLAMLELGLALLDQVDVPLLVGDFPNMSSAVGRGMLQASQQPEVATLDRLNERVHAWAAQREHTLVIPLASTVAAMRAGAAFTLGRHEWPANSTDRVLLPDHLHPTLEGLAGIAHMIGAQILDGGLATEDELEIDLAKLLDAFGKELDDA